MASPEDDARRARAEARRSRVSLRKTTHDAPDAAGLRGEEAVTLAGRMSRYSWSLAGGPIHDHSRADLPFRWVRRERA